MAKDLDGFEGAFRASGFPLVEFDRKPRDSHRVRCFVLQVTREFTLAQIVEDDTHVLNGYAIVRNDTIRRWRCVHADEFLRVRSNTSG